MKIKIGTVIENHLIYAIYGTEHCIARPILPDGEFVVWHIDEDGKGVWGRFVFLRIRWMQSGNMPAGAFRGFRTMCCLTANEDDDEVEEADEKTA